jgi:peptidoglycan L-alanyl-D-glutamate endopeptidase CwlK
MENGKPDWSVTNPKWTKAGEIGKSVGLVWGGSWAKAKDYPHFEMADA